MLSHLHKIWEWCALHLGVASQKSQLSHTDEQKAMAKAMKLLNLIKSRKFQEALQDGSPTIKLLVSAATLEKAFDDFQKAQGLVQSFEPLGVEGFHNKTVAKVLVRFEHADLMAVIAINSKGLIGGFRLKPTKDVPSLWKHPSYADPTLFIEEDITLHANEIEVEATITLPKEGNPIGAVVFLGGSGPTDRDSSLGPNKPLKDLAWGLASRQIAVCRWDKPSAENSDKLSNDSMTLLKEYLPYSTAAIEALRTKLASVNAADIPFFITGHSLGAVVAPSLAASNPSIKGIILLSAAGGKMYDSALRQVKYLSSIEHDPPFTTAELAPALAKQVAVIKSPDFNVKTASEDLPFGAPATYWLSVKEYDQVVTAAKLDIPIMVLQPGRDYQVTVEDDLEKWRVGLEKGGKNVAFKTYDALNHLLIADGGDGLATPDAYATEGHVDEKVVLDICAWLKEHSAQHI